MNIAITGGAGFIGSVLARILIAQGHDIRLLDVQESKLYPEFSQIVDVCDEAALTDSLKGVDVIYHLAAAHRDDVQPVSEYYEVNGGGAQNIIAAAKAHDIKTIIFTSTVAVYGLNAGDSRETDQPAPFNDYGRSKLESEHIFERWVDEDEGRSLSMMRLVATFGPGNRGNIYNLLRQIAGGRFVMVGRGRNHKSIAYVENVAGFLAHLLGQGPGSHLYNYADKPDLSMKELVTTARTALGRTGVGLYLPYFIGLSGGFVFDLLAKITGKTFPISLIRVRKFCADTVVNADKLEETGFKRPTTLTEGLSKTIKEEFGA